MKIMVTRYYVTMTHNSINENDNNYIFINYYKLL